MRFPPTPSQILGLHHLWRGSIHGPKEDSDNHRVEETGYRSRRTMLPQFCELLSNLHLKLFQDCCFVDLIDSQRQARVECGSKPSIWNSEEGVYNGASWLPETVLSRNGCFWLCPWSGPFTTWQRWTPPSCHVSLTKIYCCRDQLWDPRQGALSHCRLVPRMASFSQRSSTSGHGLHRSQEPWYFMSAKVLNRQQARWSLSLSRFNFVITYCPGSKQIRFDALSRRAYLAPREGDVAYDQQKTTLIKLEQLQLKTVCTTTSVDASFLQDIRVSLKVDPLALKLKNNVGIFNPRGFPSLGSKVIDSESLNQPTSSSRVSRLHDADPRFQF